MEVPRLRAEGASPGRQELQVMDDHTFSRAMPYGETRSPVEEESEKEKATLLNHQSPTEGQLCASHGRVQDQVKNVLSVFKALKA